MVAANSDRIYMLQVARDPSGDVKKETEKDFAEHRAEKRKSLENVAKTALDESSEPVNKKINAGTGLEGTGKQEGNLVRPLSCNTEYKRMPVEATAFLQTVH